MENSAEDLYTKIALDNKLVTKFQVRKACEEQDELAQGGQTLDLGSVMVRLGFLSDRQHQSVLNACRYRRQRDYDKRFARQVMRMELISQEQLEEALDKQKSGYSKTGAVAPLADQLTEDEMLTSEQIESVHKGIQERDRLRAQAKKGGAAALQLKTSGPTPVLDKGPHPSETGAVENDDDDIKLDLDDLDDEDLDDDDLDGLDDLDDADLDDDDLDGLDDLDDADLDSDLGDVDLDDVDLDDVDLDDEDDDGLDDLDDADLEESAADLDDEELEDASLSDLDDLDDEDLDDDDVDDIKLDLGDLDDEDLSDLVDDGREESDLANHASELDSEVQLDEEHLRDLEEIGSGEEERGWAAEAFDDRPLNQRPPSDAYPIPTNIAPAAPPPPPRPEPIPTPVGPPATPPRAPAPPSARHKAVEVASDGPIPGGDVFEGNFSDMGRIEDDSRNGSPTNNPGKATNDTRTALDIPTDVIESDLDRISELRADMRDPEEAASEERRAMIDSAVNDAVKAALRPTTPPAPPPTPSGSGVIPPEPMPDLTEDPRLRRAFERAMEAAWSVFLDELRGDFGG